MVEKVLTTSGMIDCNPNATPSTLTPLGPDDVENINESWDNMSIIRRHMLMYLANNTKPEIAHVKHACARYTHKPEKMHAIDDMKHILRNL